MSKQRLTEEQIAFALRQTESSVAVAKVCRKMQISDQTVCRWKQKFAGMGVAEVRRSKQVEYKNRKHKQPVADLSRDKATLQDAPGRGL